MVEVGKWDAGLFGRFRKLVRLPRRDDPSDGARVMRGLSTVARMILDRIIFQNEPLIKVLVAQLCGIGEQKRRRGLKTSMGRVPGAELLSWEDAMQAGRFGFAKACIAFEPEKGKIAGYARKKIFYELQCVIEPQYMIHVPRERLAEFGRPGCALVGEQADLDALSTDAEWAGLAEVEGLSPEMVAEWRRTGEWPEREEFDAMVAAARSPKVISIPSPALVLTPLERFLKEACKVSPSARVAQFDFWSAFARDCRRRGDAPPTMRALTRELGALRGVREVQVRLGDVPRRGLAGIRMATP